MARRYYSSRGFAIPLMIVGSIMVGLLALIGVKNILQKSVSPSIIASQTVQGNGSVQKIATAPTPTDSPNSKFTITGSSCIATPVSLTYAHTVYNSRAECEAAVNIPPTTTPTVAPTSGNTSGCGNQTFTVDPCLVDTSTPKVTVVFKLAYIAPLKKAGKDNSLQKDNNYYICLKSSVSDCTEDDWLGPVTQKDKAITDMAIPVCGDGTDALKLICAIDGHDWFHPGKVYNVFLAQGPNNKLSASDVIATASFYVTHFPPKIVLPKNPSIDYDLNMAKIGDGGTHIPVRLQGRNIQAGLTDSDSNSFNDYSVRVIGVDNEYKSSATGCIYIYPNYKNLKDPASALGGTDIQLPNISPDTSDNPVYLTAGQYVIQIKDGKGGNGGSIGTTLGKETCTEGDFTFFYIPFTIGEDEKNNGSFGAAIPDPKQQEKAPNLTPPPPPAPICFKKDMQDGYCTGIPTALGFIIHTEPTRFIGDIFTIVLSIGGIAAILFFIQAGYGLMTSAGNKEKVAASREQITAAVLGLLFIILSITILEFIGINILHIPGFK